MFNSLGGAGLTHDAKFTSLASLAANEFVLFVLLARKEGTVCKNWGSILERYLESLFSCTKNYGECRVNTGVLVIEQELRKKKWSTSILVGLNTELRYIS